MLREQGSIGALHMLSLQLPAAPPVTHTRLNISGCVDYLIWSVQAAAADDQVREAKQMLEQAVEAYIDAVAARVGSPEERGEHSR